MARKNHRRQAPQARRRRPEELAPARSLPKPPPIEATIIPHGRCSRSGKLRFHGHEAPEALKQAQTLRRSRGQEAHMEQRYYECEACGSWHLTSRTHYIERTSA